MDIVGYSMRSVGWDYVVLEADRGHIYTGMQ